MKKYRVADMLGRIEPWQFAKAYREACEANRIVLDSDPGRPYARLARLLWVAATWIILAACTLLLSGCPKRAMVATPPPEPPRVDCEQGPTDDVPRWPFLWWADGPTWGIVTLGILTQERELRAAEHQCLADLRARGVIR